MCQHCTAAFADAESERKTAESKLAETWTMRFVWQTFRQAQCIRQMI
jgi:hypothetical protein